MNERITDPATLPDEAEAALANMDIPLANALRSIRLRMQGLPVEGDPEPQAQTGEATAPAIAPASREQPDNGIEVKATTERKTTAAEPPKDDAVATALVPLKAHARRLSPVRRRLEESAVRVKLELPAEVIFQHSVFCQTVLPYRDPGSEARVWERRQGQASLLLEAGHIRGPEGKFIPVGLPYGPAARLILAHLNTTALQTRVRIIEIGSSMTAYIHRLSGRQACGRDINRFKEQLIRLLGCVVRIGYDCGERAIQVNSHILSAFALWEECFDGERFLFPQEIALSADYFESLLAHAVPLDERAIAALAHSAMGLDVYMWLAQRLHRVDPQRAQFIPWTALYAQFGQGFDRIRKFREFFLGILQMVKTQYPAARFKTDKGGMLLACSPPPVPSRHAILLPSAKPFKG